MEELAHLFHYIHDTDFNRNDSTAYFHPHPSVQHDLLFKEILPDTSRYYLIEVKGAQSFVIAEDKTKYTRRTICMTNNLDEMSLNFKSVRMDSDSRQKYVFINFPTVALLSEPLFDPKSIEIYNTKMLNFAFINSSDPTVELKATGLKELLLSSASSFISNIDLSTTPSDKLTIFLQDVEPRDLIANAPSEVVLFQMNNMHILEFQNAEKVTLKTEKECIMDSLIAPNCDTLSVYFSEIKPQAKSIYVPNLKILKLEDMCMHNDASYEDELCDLLANPGLYENIEKCKVSTWLDGRRVLQHLTQAHKLEQLQIAVNQVLDSEFTKSLSFPNLKRLEILGLGGEIIPEFHIPSVEDLVVTCNAMAVIQPVEFHLNENYPNVESIAMDSCGLPTIQTIFGNSEFEHLKSLTLVYLTLSGTQNVLDLNSARFPKLKILQLDLYIDIDLPIKFENVEAPQLEEFVCKLNHEDIFPDGTEFQPQPIEITGYPKLTSLIISGVMAIYIKECPELQHVYHGGIHDLERFDCDASVDKLKVLVYRSSSAIIPIQGMQDYSNIEMSVIDSDVHPMESVFTKIHNIIDLLDE
jgi:hypothetical protein